MLCNKWVMALVGGCGCEYRFGCYFVVFSFVFFKMQNPIYNVN